MRFEKGHKERTRKQVLDVASRRFRKDGIAASGIAGIMAEAGLTNGAFYLHFESKDALVREALANALAHQQDILDQQPGDARDIEGAIRAYLNRSHVVECDVGCPSAALLPEIGRQPSLTRETYEAGLRSYISVLASYLPDTRSSRTQQRAMAIFGLMVGTLQIARSVNDRELSDRILEGGVDAALRLAKDPPGAASSERPTRPASKRKRK